MFEKPDQLSKALIKVDTLPSIVMKRSKLLEVISEFPEELPVILSLSYRLKGVYLPNPTKRSIIGGTSSWEVIFGTILYYYRREDISNIHKYYKALPYTWQVILYYSINKTIISSIGNKALFEALPTIYTEEELISLVTLPEALNQSFSMATLRNKDKEEILLPVKLYSGLKAQNMKKLVYLINYGTKVITNTKSNSARYDILNKLGKGMYGVIFTEHKLKGYKNRKGTDIVATGTIEDIMRAYRGVDIGDIAIKLKYLGEFNSMEEISNILVPMKNTNNILVLSNNTIQSVKLNTETVTLKVIDYITDKDFTPIGVTCDYYDKEVKVYFTVTNTTLVNGITDRFIKVNMHKYLGEVIKVIYQSTVPKVSLDSCKCCMKYNTRLTKTGLCIGCLLTIRRNLSSGRLQDTPYNGEEFKLLVRNYEVLGNTKDIQYKLLKGQGVLDLW